MNPRAQRRWKILGWLALTALVVGLISAWVLGGALCAPANRAVPIPAGLAIETVTFSSRSGSTIHGWLVTPATNHGVVILQHGIRGSRSDMVSRAQFLSAAGYAVLLFDFQAHGESPGTNITLGFLESRDSEAAVAFAKNRFPGKPIGVIGESLGAAAAALAEPPLDVQAMVLELMYPSVVEATKDRCEIVLGKPGRLLSYLLTSQMPFRLGCSEADLRPIEHVAKLTMPKLFIAGTADHHTKLSESKAIFASAAEPKTFVAFDGAKHQDLHAFDREKYEKLILNFFNEHLK